MFQSNKLNVIFQAQGRSPLAEAPEVKPERNFESKDSVESDQVRSNERRCEEERHDVRRRCQEGRHDRGQDRRSRG